MKTNIPVIKILRKMKIKNDSVLNKVVRYLHDTEKMPIHDITSILGISLSSVYNALKKKPL